MTDKKTLEKTRENKKDDLEKDLLGDKSAYGEFVSTFHHWVGLEGTHKRGEELSKIAAPKNNRGYRRTFYPKNKEE